MDAPVPMLTSDERKAVRARFCDNAPAGVATAYAKLAQAEALVYEAEDVLEAFGDEDGHLKAHDTGCRIASIYRDGPMASTALRGGRR